MFARLAAMVALLATLALMLVACEVSPATPMESVEPPPPGTPAPIPSPTPASSYLTEEIPPCTPAPGSSVDPCELGPELLNATGAMMIDVGDEPFSVKYFVEGVRTLVPHIVLRGTYLPDTVRCASEHKFRPPSYPGPGAFGSLSNQPMLHCFADVRANAYILGSGPSTLTVEVVHDTYPSAWEQVRIEEWERLWEHTLIEGGRVSAYHLSPIEGREAILFVGPTVNTSIEAWKVFDTWNIERRNDSTVIAVHPYRRSFPLEEHRAALEMELPAFTQAVAMAHKARMIANGGRTQPNPAYPMLVTDANKLRQFYIEIGAYDDLENPPAQPPPVPLACDRAVPDAANNPNLLADCKALAAFRDGLGDAGTLDWSSSTPIGQWEGVTVGGTPKRVQALDLEEKGLTGTLPADLGNLTGLTRLNLEYNDLRGELPATLGNLKGLVSLSLSGNRLTGAIPSALGGLTRLTTLDLAGNDLTGAPPTELGNLRAVTYLSLGGNDLTGPVPAWVSGLPNLQELYLDGNAFTGTIPTGLGQLPKLQVLALGRNQLTGTIPPVLGNLKGLEELALHRNHLTGSIPVELLGLPDLEHLYLSGNRLTGCVPSGLRGVANNDLARLNLPTCANQAPVFAQAGYAFSVATNAAMGTTVGAVSATDADPGDAVAYAITAGNGGGEFAISEGTGVITVAKALREGASYTLTVEAADRNRGTATVTVSIAVTDAAGQ